MSKFIDCVIYAWCLALASASVMLIIAAIMMMGGYV
ncbi:hypothetical protein bas03_0083 [Escherichia phage JulesPiccard]|uniref:Uncharacterized protein n=1 Tax=Escherichia phage JulesPiccard TaxID=2851956 RepID=A0AAE8B2T8_9CAUD|nr:hypothetical protein bas03_0083 [Escherichia phage JulesPiccard]